MRDDEEYVLKSVARFYSREWRPGEDPPDGYLTVANRTIAVEVSTLTQHITDHKGTRPRRSDDTQAIRLANELDLDFKAQIPTDKRVMAQTIEPL